MLGSTTRVLRSGVSKQFLRHLRRVTSTTQSIQPPTISARVISQGARTGSLLAFGGTCVYFGQNAELFRPAELLAQCNSSPEQDTDSDFTENNVGYYFRLHSSRTDDGLRYDYTNENGMETLEVRGSFSPEDVDTLKVLNTFREDHGLTEATSTQNVKVELHCCDCGAVHHAWTKLCKTSPQFKQIETVRKEALLRRLRHQTDFLKARVQGLAERKAEYEHSLEAAQKAYEAAQRELEQVEQEVPPGF
eukprot:gb/GEZN01008911.1/.p1 GENE.gb/GEZN01008911.1/~~gb/GEZN01008911.1/.p1  ORF type:complete len:248 (-),score=27.05 gb/GEZN01008911.1/:559-1302(-)